MFQIEVFSLKYNKAVVGNTVNNKTSFLLMDVPSTLDTFDPVDFKKIISIKTFYKSTYTANKGSFSQFCL